MEKTILLLQTEITLLQFLHNSTNETIQSMKGRIGYDLNYSMNRTLMSLEGEIVTKRLEIDKLKQV